MGPISTGLGEIYQFEVRGEGYDLMELRSILDWDIAFKLRSVPGVVEVNSYGGELKAYEVQLDADKLVSYNLSLEQVFEALEQNNSNCGGAYIERRQEQVVIRGEGLVDAIEDIENIVVAAGRDGTPIYIKNLGRVVMAPRVRQGAVTRDGRGEAVTGVVMMLIGENARVVVDRVKRKIEEIKKTLPPGVEIGTYYDRTELVRKTIRTVIKNLTEGGLLVIAILLLLLGNLRGGLMVASAIPPSMLFAFTGMVYAGLSGNLMSLGAIDFGLIVDGSVVMIENIVRKLSEKKTPHPGRLAVILDAGREVARPVFFAVLIIIIVYLPVLALEGVEGKMFRPMALTVIFALCGSLILALTLMPTLVILVGMEKSIVGLIALRDEVRPQAQEVVDQLHRMGIKVAMLTGDHPTTAYAIAKQLGIDHVRADLKPEEKIAAIEELEKRFGPTAMVGDGINDAPALARATVGIAMGAVGTDAAIEAADIALMADDLTKVIYAINLGHRARRISLQNIIFSLTILALLIPSALAGMMTVARAVFLHEASELLAVANGLRVASEASSPI